MAEKNEMSVEQLLKDAELRAVAFEEAIQSGEHDASPTEQAKLALQRERAKQIVKYRSDWEQAVARKEVRRVLWSILSICGPNRLSPDISNPYATAENNGMRRVANEILVRLFDADPNVYSQMQREFLSDLKAEQGRKENELKKSKEEQS